jgi:hypothetical protein
MLSQLNAGVRQQHPPHDMKAILLFIGIAGAVACSDPAVRTRVAATSSYLSCRPAPAPGANWRTVELTLPAVTFQIPPGWREKQWDVRVGEVNAWHTFRSEADFFQNLSITEERDSAAGPLPKVMRQADYTDYVECADSIGGHHVLLQAWRGGGTVFREGRQTPTFATQLTLEIGPGHYAVMSATSGDAAGQDEMVTVLKTFRARASDGK